jgi:hypothetical protein
MDICAAAPGASSAATASVAVRKQQPRMASMQRRKSRLFYAAQDAGHVHWQCEAATAQLP